jgi:DNA recombination protein RmuC
MQFAFLAIGLILGFLIGWLFFRNKSNQNNPPDPRLAEIEKVNASLTGQIQVIADERKRGDEQLKIQRDKTETELELERAKVGVLTDQLGRKEVEFDNIQQRLQEQKAELEQLQERFTKEFENLANKIFEEKSQKFTEQNRNQIDTLLKPLGEKIKDFEKKVEDAYKNESLERASLKGEILVLRDLNKQMTDETKNLTSALKGDSQARGAWGQRILESVLEKSGLQKDREYRSQPSFTNEDGGRSQPDFIVDLPDGKSLVIDSKVSLVAYIRYTNAVTEEERAIALKEHLTSVKGHIKDLSGKKYHEIYQINSLDFVFLFMPIESAFIAAQQADPELFNDAFSRNIILASPSTLLAMLRTVANIWRQENQNRNVIRIAEEAAGMYDKFVGFTEAMIEVGKKLDAGKSEYETAMKRLSTGSGNIVNRIESLRKLGLKVNKELNPKLVERAEETDKHED